MSASDKSVNADNDNGNANHFNDNRLSHEKAGRSLGETSSYSLVEAKEFDKFYTKPDVAAHCLKRAASYVGGRILIEPSAGSGNMLDAANTAGFECYGFDIAPEAGRPDIQMLDYLAGPIRDHLPNDIKGKQLACVGNPPFGSKGDLALQFLNKGLDETGLVCFILPLCATEWSFQKHVKPGAKLVHCERLPSNSFTLCGEPRPVDCAIQIWTMDDLGPDLRITETPLVKKPDFKMVRYNCAGDPSVLKDDWEFAVRAQAYGDAAGVRLERGSDLNPKHQWMMFWPYNVGARIILNGIDFKDLCRGTTSVKGFGKAHVITAYNEALQAANDNSPSSHSLDASDDRIEDGEAS